MAVRFLLVLTALGVFYGCGQASSPPERQEKQGGVEEVAPEEVEAPEKVAENEQAQGATDSKPPGEGGLSQQQRVEKYGPHRGSASVHGSASATSGSQSLPAGYSYETWVALCRWMEYGVGMSTKEFAKYSNDLTAHANRYKKSHPDATDQEVLDSYGVPRYADTCDRAGYEEFGVPRRGIP
jgi:hypothetical protein